MTTSRRDLMRQLFAGAAVGPSLTACYAGLTPAAPRGASGDAGAGPGAATDGAQRSDGPGGAAATPSAGAVAQDSAQARPGARLLKSSLNAWSFNAPLSSGELQVEDMFRFCSDLGISAVDLTAYYIDGYPNVPPSSTLHELKRQAFRLGLDISGTGVRNDFTESDPGQRQQSVALVKRWIEAAAQLGAPVLRIFAGQQTPAGFTRAQVLDWMLEDIQSCVRHGQAHGVVVAIQNHDDFIKTAPQAIEIVQAINSPWFGLILDTGSYRTADPYEEIAESIPYAVNWQIKEEVYVRGQRQPADIPRLGRIIRASNYRGYLPIEILTEGDPKARVASLHARVGQALGNHC